MLRPGNWQWFFCAMVLLAAVSAPASAVRAADDDGQPLLDKATEAKLSAETLADLNQVIRLCREAIDAGLDDDNKKFARELLASTLSQRAEVVCLELFERPVTPNRARRLVQMALEDLEETVQINSEQPESQFLLGRLYAHLGETEKGLAALNEAVRLSESDPAAKSKALMIRANLKKDPAAQQADYDEAVKLSPRDPNVLRFRGMHYLTQSNIELAIADLNAAIELDPLDPDTYEARGMAQALAEKLDDALESFNKAIELEPTSTTALVHRARLRAMKGDFPAALADVEQAMKLRPGSLQAVLLHASLLGAMGKFDQALAELNVLRQVIPDSPEVLLQLGTLYQAAKQPQQAIETFNHVIAQDPKNAAALRGRADAYLNQGKQVEAIADYEEVLKVDPKNSGVLNNLAWVLATSPDDKLRDGKRAIELAKQACEVTEYKQAHILSTLAAGYAETGDFDTAITWSKKAVELGSDQTKVQLEKELESYQAGKPWREAAPPDEPPLDETAQGNNDAAPSNEDTARAKRGS
ncbi:MAG: tetratricopeptide repeat protein [Pirellulales bacterium]